MIHTDAFAVQYKSSSRESWDRIRLLPARAPTWWSLSAAGPGAPGTLAA